MYEERKREFNGIISVGVMNDEFKKFDCSVKEYNIENLIEKIDV